MTEWIVVVPVKGTDLSKSRLAELPATVAFRRRLALAFALDTVEALLAASRVAEILIVTNDAESAARLVASSARVSVVPDPGDGLNAAITAGLSEARRRRSTAAVAAITGDLPALTATDVDVALLLAARHPSSFISDLAGTGTTTITALPGSELVPRFGVDSAKRHAAAGLVELDLGPLSTIRRDVDTPEDVTTGTSDFGRHSRAELSSAA